MKKIILTILLVTIIVGCSSVKERRSEIRADFKNLSSITSRNLEFNGKVEIDVDGKSFTLNTDIYSADNDSVLMVMKAFMGIPAAKVYADSDEFLAYNAIENTAFYGEPTKENIEKAIQIGFSYQDMIALLRNEPNLEMDYKVSESGSTEEEVLYYRYFKDDYIEYVKYNIKDNYISQYQQKSKENVLLLNVYFEEPQLVGKRNMPFKVTALLPEREGSVKFRFDKIKEIGSFNKEFNFTIPNNVSKIKL